MPSLGESLIRRDFVAAFIYVVDVELVVGDDEVGAGIGQENACTCFEGAGIRTPYCYG